MEPVLHLVPKGRAAQRLLHDLVELATAEALVDSWPVRNVVIDRFRERVPPLEYHAHAMPEMHHVHVRSVYVSLPQENAAGMAGAGGGVGHPIDAAQERGFATSRRAAQSGGGASWHGHVGALQRLLLPVPERDVAGR